MNAASSIIPFENEEFGTIRTVEQNGRVIFCGKDVAIALGYSNPSKALRDHTRGERIVIPLETSGGIQQVQFITEGDLYRLVSSSKLPSALKFEAWVFDEVLPSIRKRGGYMVEVPNETPEQTMARAILIARDTIERQRADIDMLAGENAVLAPKAAMADAFLDADGAYTITQASGLLRQLDGSMSRRRLFQLLRVDHMIEQRTNRATARAVERGYLTNIATSFTAPDGERRVRDPYALVTPKGLEWMARRYCAPAYQPPLQLEVVG